MRKDLLLVGLLMVVLTLMVVPLPTQLIDALLTFSIGLGVLLLLAAVYVRQTYEFSTLPTIILIATIFRLALSIATTRSILSEAEAGDIIATFGDFVVGGSVAIGLVIFLIIAVVQFLVVTKGAERVAEVGARFALDALPGKQMSIDADIRAGTIDQDEGKRLRGLLDRESRFFGAMDGTMKFVKGDAIAGLVIIAINLIGGIAVGMTLHGFSIGEAVAVFSLLTVGDGLLAQIPALFIALAAGILITRIDSGETSDLGTRIADQLIADPRVLGTAAAILLGLGMVPGLPVVIFAGGAIVLALAAFVMQQRLTAKAVAQADEAEAEALELAEDLKAAARTPDTSDRFVLKLGSGVLTDLEYNELMGLIEAKFAEISTTIGITLLPPKCEISDSCHARDVVIELDDVPIHQDRVPQHCVAVRFAGNKPGKVKADPIRLSGIASRLFWVRVENLDGLARRDEKIPLVSLLTKVVKSAYERHRATWLSLADVTALMEHLAATHPREVATVRNSQSEADLYDVVRSLVSDGVPLKPRRLFLESFAQIAQSKPGISPSEVADHLRIAMRRQYCRLLAGTKNVLGVVLLDPGLEAAIRQHLMSSAGATPKSIVPGSELSDLVLSGARHFVNLAPETSPVLVIANDLRSEVKLHLAQNGLNVPVLAPQELSHDVRCVPVGRITGNMQETQNYEYLHNTLPAT